MLFGSAAVAKPVVRRAAAQAQSTAANILPDTTLTEVIVASLDWWCWAVKKDSDQTKDVIENLKTIVYRMFYLRTSRFFGG
jgi:hypothetical protein